MQIVWDETAAKKLREKHVVLELESFLVEGMTRTVYCVIPAEKIGLNIPAVDGIVALHHEFITAFNAKDYDKCQELSQFLLGSFDGEVDSFYEEILDRINKV